MAQRKQGFSKYGKKLGRPIRNIFRTDYRPRPQQDMMSKGRKRFTVAVCHRRMGKSTWAIHEAVMKAWTCPLPKPRVALISPFYGQAIDNLWEPLLDYCKYMTEKQIKIKEGDPKKVRFLHNDATIFMYGAENAARLRGGYFDLVVLDEYGFMDTGTLDQVLFPAIAERQGEIIYISTVNGKNQLYKIHSHAVKVSDKNSKDYDPDYAAFTFKLSETNKDFSLLPEKEVERQKLVMDEADYEREFEAAFDAPVKGSFFGKMLRMYEGGKNSHIGKHPHIPELPVFTSWDLGVDDTTAIWFLQIEHQNKINVIDYYEDSGEGIEYYLKMLRDKQDTLNYRYALHYAPHDARHREMGTGKSIQEISRNWDVRFDIVERTSKQQSIEACRVMIPLLHFNTDNEFVATGYENLKMYSREYNHRLKVFKKTPKHDEFSNAADAMFQFCLKHRKNFEETSINVNTSRIKDGVITLKTVYVVDPSKPSDGTHLTHDKIISPQVRMPTKIGRYVPPNVVIGRPKR